jgi:hypothetical protein
MISILRGAKYRTWQSRSRSNNATTSYSGEESFWLDQIIYSTTKLEPGLELGTDIYGHGRWRELRKVAKGLPQGAQRALAYDQLNIARTIAVLSLLFAAAPGFAQVSERLDPIVVTATRVEERAFELPLSIDSLNAAQIQQNQLQINLSESLLRVPGLSVQNRWNYAQDLQVSSRGFGARAAFGVRGIRLYQDGIPATMPGGQGQTGSFSLASAKRIEVLRGPFSTLYGNAAGGVISVFSEDGPDPPQAQAQIIAGSYGTWHALAKVGGEARGVNFVVAESHFHTDGYRDHSDASRELFNAKLKFDPGSDTHVTLIANSLYQPEAQDPLGLTRAQWQSNPRQVDPVAVQFDTRKTVGQQQGGASIEQRLAADSVLRITTYGGQRSVRQYLALSGIGATSSGGVTDLDGEFVGVDARVSTRRSLAGGPLLLTVAAAYDRQHQRRRGFVNNNGALGDLRRDEDDYVSDRDAYAQAEWTPIAAVSTLLGVRYSDVRFVSNDHYITSSNPDDSGRVGYTHTNPVVGASGAWPLTSTPTSIGARMGRGIRNADVHRACVSPGWQRPQLCASTCGQPVDRAVTALHYPAVHLSRERGLSCRCNGDIRCGPRIARCLPVRPRSGRYRRFPFDDLRTPEHRREPASVSNRLAAIISGCSARSPRENKIFVRKARAELFRTYGRPTDVREEKITSAAADLARSLGIDNNVRREDKLVRYLWASKGRLPEDLQSPVCECGSRYVAAALEISRSPSTIIKNQYFVLSLSIFVLDADLGARRPMECSVAATKKVVAKARRPAHVSTGHPQHAAPSAAVLRLAVPRSHCSMPSRAPSRKTRQPFGTTRGLGTSSSPTGRITFYCR